MALGGILPVGLILSGKISTAGTLTQGVILVMSIVLIKEKKVFVCKVNLLRTVHYMNHAYIQLVFVSMFENLFCTTVFLHRLISSLVSACSDEYFMLHSLNRFSTFQVQKVGTSF